MTKIWNLANLKTPLPLKFSSSYFLHSASHLLKPSIILFTGTLSPRICGRGLTSVAANMLHLAEAVMVKIPGSRIPDVVTRKLDLSVKKPSVCRGRHSSLGPPSNGTAARPTSATSQRPTIAIGHSMRLEGRSEARYGLEIGGKPGGKACATREIDIITGGAPRFARDPRRRV